MLLQEPKSFDNLVKVTNKQNEYLQDNGFSPAYKWQGYFYYIKSENLLKILN